MEKEKLEQQLEHFFQAEVQGIEPSDEWWNKTIARVGEQKRHSRWFGLVPKTRLAWAFLPLVVLLLGGAVYGASSLLSELFQKHAPQIEEAGLAQELDLSQTINGITVKLERAYADSNVTLVGFTVIGPDTRYQAEIGGLSTADGENLPGMIGFGTGSKEIMGNLSSSATIYTFDTSSLKNVPSELSLIFEASVADLPMIGKSKTLAGPFRFEFDVPFHAGKSIDIGQTVESAGIPITLERVVISHWATQAIFSFAPPYDNIKTRPLIIASVEPAGGDIVNSGLGKTKEEASAEYFNGDLTAHSGEWTVTVKELVFPPESPTPGTHPASDTKRLAGPWVFRFQVP